MTSPEQWCPTSLPDRDPTSRIFPVMNEEAKPLDIYTWDRLHAEGKTPTTPRPFGPSRDGSRSCKSGSLASGGENEYCTCSECF